VDLLISNRKQGQISSGVQNVDTVRGKYALLYERVLVLAASRSGVKNDSFSSAKSVDAHHKIIFAEEPQLVTKREVKNDSKANDRF